MRASRRNPGIARRADNLADVAVGDQPGDQRVLARAAADDQNSHCLKGLRACAGMHAQERSAGTISLTLTGIAPRIRAYP